MMKLVTLSSALIHHDWQNLDSEIQWVFNELDSTVVDVYVYSPRSNKIGKLMSLWSARLCLHQHLFTRTNQLTKLISSWPPSLRNIYRTYLQIILPPPCTVLHHHSTNLYRSCRTSMHKNQSQTRCEYLQVTFKSSIQRHRSSLSPSSTYRSTQVTSTRILSIVTTHIYLNGGMIHLSSSIQELHHTGDFG